MKAFNGVSPVPTIAPGCAPCPGVGQRRDEKYGLLVAKAK